MVDNSLVGIGLTALATKDIIIKLLGPTADYLGGEAAEFIKKCNINLSDIFLKAYHKLGERVDQPGKVNPRVLIDVIRDGTFCEDDLSKEYFAGVLASSRTTDGKDDRGVTNTKLISGLSSFQIKAHYIFYTLLRNAFLPYSSSVYPGVDRSMMYIYIPTEDYYSASGINSDYTDENEKLNLLTHSINGLRRSDLIHETYTFGNAEVFKKYGIKYRLGEQFPLNEDVLSNHGIAFQPTPGGMELYLWVHGLGQYNHFKFLDNELPIELIEGINIPSNVEILYKDFVDNVQKSREAIKEENQENQST